MKGFDSVTFVLSVGATGTVTIKAQQSTDDISRIVSGLDQTALVIIIVPGAAGE
jgi:hypothetical protein